MELPLRFVAADPLREGVAWWCEPGQQRGSAIAAGADGLAHLFDDLAAPSFGFAEFAENVIATLLPVFYQGRAVRHVAIQRGNGL